MSQTEVILGKGSQKDIKALMSGQDRVDVALSALREEVLSSKQIADLLKLAKKYESLPTSISIASPLESERQNYDDTRSGVAPHPAINFSVAVNSDVVAAALLKELLGEDATVLMSDWGNLIDFTKNAPDSNKATLLIDSNNKNRTTQGEDFKASGLEFADDLQATIVYATLVKKAKDAGLDLRDAASSWKNSWKANQLEAIRKLSSEELDLLTKLRDGIVRTRSRALYVDYNGRLRVIHYDDQGYPALWALGASPSAE